MKLIEEKLKKKYFEMALLEINEIAPSMLVDYNKFIKNLEVLRAENHNIFTSSVNFKHRF